MPQGQALRAMWLQTGVTPWDDESQERGGLEEKEDQSDRETGCLPCSRHGRVAGLQLRVRTCSQDRLGMRSSLYSGWGSPRCTEGAAGVSGAQGTNVVGEKTHLQRRSDGEGAGGPVWEVSPPAWQW